MIEPLPFRINDATVLRIVRKLATDSMNVRLLSHAKLRMRQRRITMTQVYACLCQGVIAEPTHQDVRGDWRFTLTHRHAGDIVNVAGAIKKDDNGEWVAVITVF
jgi:hypothetical protein